MLLLEKEFLEVDLSRQFLSINMIIPTPDFALLDRTESCCWGNEANLSDNILSLGVSVYNKGLVLMGQLPLFFSLTIITHSE